MSYLTIRNYKKLENREGIKIYEYTNQYNIDFIMKFFSDDFNLSEVDLRFGIHRESIDDEQYRIDIKIAGKAIGWIGVHIDTLNDYQTMVGWMHDIGNKLIDKLILGKKSSLVIGN